MDDVKVGLSLLLAKVTGRATPSSPKLPVSPKSIISVVIVINQTQKENFRKIYKGKVQASEGD